MDRPKRWLVQAGESLKRRLVAVLAAQTEADPPALAFDLQGMVHHSSVALFPRPADFF